MDLDSPRSGGLTRFGRRGRGFDRIHTFSSVGQTDYLDIRQGVDQVYKLWKLQPTVDWDGSRVVLAELRSRKFGCKRAVLGLEFSD